MAVIPERRVESVHCCARHNLSRRSPAVPSSLVAHSTSSLANRAAIVVALVRRHLEAEWCSRERKRDVSSSWTDPPSAIPSSHRSSATIANSRPFSPAFSVPPCGICRSHALARASTRLPSFLLAVISVPVVLVVLDFCSLTRTFSFPLPLVDSAR